MTSNLVVFDAAHIISSWGGPSSGFSTDQEHTAGQASYKLVGGEGDGWEGIDFFAANMVVTPGQRFEAEVWVYPLTQVGTVEFSAYWIDSTGTLASVGNTFDPNAIGGWQTPIPEPGKWTRLGGGHVTVPAGYDRFEPFIEFNGDAPGVVLYLADPVVREYVPAVTMPAATQRDVPQGKVVTDDLIVSLHDDKGVQLYQFLPEDYTSCTWGRTSRDASQCDLVVPPLMDADRLPDIVAWHHWLSVYDGERDTLMWTGPIQSARGNRGGLSLNAKDHAAYLMRTRNPITKRWDAADPSSVAGELWEAMIGLQGLDTAAIVRPDPEGDRYDFQVLTDAQMLDQTLTDLVNLGLRWTVVSGVPILGPLPLEPVASLGEDDFQGDGIDFVRDGSAVFNDVLVRGPDNLARARVAYFGQNLQTIANIDNMFGVSNVNKAAQQYVRQTGAVRTKLELPSSTVLHPDAPVSIDELMPSARFVIEANGIRQLMLLTAVEVERRQGVTAVKVTMESLPDRDLEGHLIELATDKNAPVVTLGGQATGR